MRAIEQSSLAAGRTLLVLDTLTGDIAEPLDLKLGWQRAGVIPNYAFYPTGSGATPSSSGSGSRRFYTRSMRFAGLSLLFSFASIAHAQTACTSVSAMAPCQISFAVNEPNAYRTVEISVEFRSPSHQTYLVPGYWTGSGFNARLEPEEAGTWDYRVSSNLPRFDAKTGQFNVTESSLPANTFHFWTVPGKKPHLWMGFVAPEELDRAALEALIGKRSQQHFNHVRLMVLDPKAFAKGELVNPAPFDRIDAAVLAANRLGMTADLVIAGPDEQLLRVFPDHDQRERYLRYLCGRYSGLNITWQGIDQFETYANGRDLLQEIAQTITRFDGHHHPLSSLAQVTSAPLANDQWIKFLTYRTSDAAVGAVERQFFALPAVNDFNADGNRDPAVFRHRLWNSAMSGQYPEVTVPDEEAASAMKNWYEFFAQTRHWELSPFFDADGGRAAGLDEVEYIIYAEKPGPVEVRLDQKHKYDLRWFNPINGESVEFKPEKAETIGGQPPDNAHDWVLSVARTGRKESMAKSYYFESKTPDVQEIDSNPAKLPFELEVPNSAETLRVGQAIAYRLKLKRETRASKAMQYVITGEVTADGQGYRVLATGASGTLNIPVNIARRYPALLHLRVEAVNGVGRAYSLDQNFTLAR
jgi:hypothetical protein